MQASNHNITLFLHISCPSIRKLTTYCWGSNFFPSTIFFVFFSMFKQLQPEWFSHFILATLTPHPSNFQFIYITFLHLSQNRSVSKLCWEHQHTTAAAASAAIIWWCHRVRWTAIFNEGSFISSSGGRYDHIAMQSEKFRKFCVAMAKRGSCANSTKFNGHQRCTI